MTAILRPAAAAQRLGISRASLYRVVQAGELPPPIRITAGASGWLIEEIDQYIRRRIAASRGEGSPREPGPEE